MRLAKAGGMAMFMAYLGAVIGAGFASGQEIVQFFVRYNAAGFLGAIVAGIGFSILAVFLIYLAKALRVSDYRGLLQGAMGPSLGRLADLGITLFLFLGICTMFSASGAVFMEHLYLPKGLGIFAAYIGVIICLYWGLSGLVIAYNVLVPIKLLLLLSIATWAALPGKGNVIRNLSESVSTASLPDYWILAALLYVAYNFTLAMVVLTEYSGLMPIGEAVTGAACGGLVLGLMAAIFHIALSNHVPQVLHYQVPMLFIAGQVSVAAKLIYVVVLWLGILTTAIANAYGIAHRFSQLTGMRFRFSLILLATLALPLSMQAFSRLVAIVYPLFGVLGMGIVLAILVAVARNWGSLTGGGLVSWLRRY